MQQHQGQIYRSVSKTIGRARRCSSGPARAASLLATIVGFSWGGWMTGGTAREMAENSAAQARQELAAVVCVDRFMAAPDVGVQLTALKEITSSYAQSKFVEEGGWAMIVPASTPLTTRRALMTARRPGCAPRSSPSARIPRPGRLRRSTTRRSSRNRRRRDWRAAVRP